MYIINGGHGPEPRSSGGNKYGPEAGSRYNIILYSVSFSQVMGNKMNAFFYSNRGSFH